MKTVIFYHELWIFKKSKWMLLDIDGTVHQSFSCTVNNLYHHKPAVSTNFNHISSVLWSQLEDVLKYGERRTFHPEFLSHMLHAIFYSY